MHVQCYIHFYQTNVPDTVFLNEECLKVIHLSEETYLGYETIFRLNKQCSKLIVIILTDIPVLSILLCTFCFYTNIHLSLHLIT